MSKELGDRIQAHWWSNAAYPKMLARRRLARDF
jgi:hypothetical protein